MKAAIMAATNVSPQVIQHLVHKLRLASSGNRHLQLLTRAQLCYWSLKDALVIFIATIAEN